MTLTTDAATLRRQLDLLPGDRTLAAMLADAAQEGGVSAGYVALARLDRVPDHNVAWYWFDDERAEPRAAWVRARLPADWFNEVVRLRVHAGHRGEQDRSVCVNSGVSRDEAEQLACVAFERLPLARQAELLRG